MNSRNLSILSCLLLGGLSALADPVTVTFVGTSGISDFGYAVGPYFGTINGDPVTLYCVDFANDVSWGETWQANLTPLDGNDLSNTRFGGAVGLSDALTRYLEAAWLTTQYASNPNDYGDIQATIWQLFDPNGPNPSTGVWADLASDNYQSIDPSRFEVVTNVAPVNATGQIQEFLIDPPPPAPVPEPSALLLLATALALSGWFLRKRALSAVRALRHPESPSCQLGLI